MKYIRPISFFRRTESPILATMAEEISSSVSVSQSTSSSSSKKSFWSYLRWVPTSTQQIIDAEQRLLSLVKTPYTQELVNIGSAPPGSKIKWFRSTSDEPRFINTITFDSKKDAPTLVMIHGYGASQGLFFRNFDSLAKHFRVIAIDQLGWGASSRPDFTCKSPEEAEAWFVDSLEEWRKAKNIDHFVLLGHSLGGYIAAKYALKHPEHVKHLVLVGSVGFSSPNEESEAFTRFKETWKGSMLKNLWESNFTPQKLVRGFGPFGPDMVRRYTSARFVAYTSGEVLSDEATTLLSDYMYHTFAARASGELCLKYIFAFGAYVHRPLLEIAPQWKVPTSLIYGSTDWVSFGSAQEARKQMNVPCEILRIPKAGHFSFIDNPDGFHASILHACRRILSAANPDNAPLPPGIQSV